MARLVPPEAISPRAKPKLSCYRWQRSGSPRNGSAPSRLIRHFVSFGRNCSESLGFRRAKLGAASLYHQGPTFVRRLPIFALVGIGRASATTYQKPPSLTGSLHNPCVKAPPSASLAALRRAVGPWPWRVGLIKAASGKAISEEMTLILALATFAGYDLFPGHDRRKPPVSGQLRKT